MTVLAVALSGCGAASKSTANHRADLKERVSGPVEIVVGRPTELTIEAPPAAARAGGERLAEFKIGRTVAAQSGCLACHRIGYAGNRGPGPDLTHVGSLLTGVGITRAILHPTAPMPSFSHIPAAKLHALVIFLSLLRRQRCLWHPQSRSLATDHSLPGATDRALPRGVLGLSRSSCGR